MAKYRERKTYFIQAFNYKPSKDIPYEYPTENTIQVAFGYELATCISSAMMKFEAKYDNLECDFIKVNIWEQNKKTIIGTS